MGKYKCICGNVVSDVYEPDTNLGYLISSWDRDLGIQDRERTVHECDQCGCLSIEDPIGTCNHKFYKPHDGKSAELFIRSDHKPAQKNCVRLISVKNVPNGSILSSDAAGNPVWITPAKGTKKE